MEFIFEIIVELLFEGIFETSKNRKISKFIRYPLIAIIVIIFTTISLGLMYIGIKVYDENSLGGIFIIFIGVFLEIASIVAFKKEYIKKANSTYTSKKKL